MRDKHKIHSLKIIFRKNISKNQDEQTHTQNCVSSPVSLVKIISNNYNEVPVGMV